MKPTPFKAKDDPENAWEIAESKLKVLYLTGDFLWSHELSPVVAINFGASAPGSASSSGSSTASRRTRPWAPPTRGLRALPRERGRDRPRAGRPPVVWHRQRPLRRLRRAELGGRGSKPNLYPWLAIPQLGCASSRTDNFVARLDAGFGTSGFFFGLGADYGL
jgi:hypothetical protein